MEIQINGKDVTAECKGLIEVMQELQSVTGQSQKTILRKATIDLLKSIRKRTATAKKRVPRKDVKKYEGDGPKWITKKGVTLRRFTVLRRAPSEDSYAFTKTAKNQSIAWQKGGKIGRAGIAKRSWGHIMALLFRQGNPDDGNQKAEIKPGMVFVDMRDTKTKTEIEIINYLRHITAATPESAVSGAISAATKSISDKVERAIEQYKQKHGLD